MTIEDILNQIGHPESDGGFQTHGYDTKWVINPKKLAEFLLALKK